MEVFKIPNQSTKDTLDDICVIFISILTPPNIWPKQSSPCYLPAEFSCLYIVFGNGNIWSYQTSKDSDKKTNFANLFDLFKFSCSGNNCGVVMNSCSSILSTPGSLIIPHQQLLAFIRGIWDEGNCVILEIFQISNMTRNLSRGAPPWCMGDN